MSNTPPSGGTLAPPPTVSHQVIVFVGAFAVALVLWQYKGTQPWVKGMAILIILGLALRYWGTIQTQFQNIGK